MSLDEHKELAPSVNWPPAGKRGKRSFLLGGKLIPTNGVPLVAGLKEEEKKWAWGEGASAGRG